MLWHSLACCVGRSPAPRASRTPRPTPSAPQALRTAAGAPRTAGHEAAPSAFFANSKCVGIDIGILCASKGVRGRTLGVGGQAGVGSKGGPAGPPSSQVQGGSLGYFARWFGVAFDRGVFDRGVHLSRRKLQIGKKPLSKAAHLPVSFV